MQADDETTVGHSLTLGTIGLSLVIKCLYR